MRKYLITLSLLCMVCSGCIPAKSGSADKQKETVVIDIDLPAFSGTMAYSTITDMLINPENYFGKTVRVRGVYEVLYYTPEHPYNFIIVDGPSGCCPQTLMFIWDTARDYDYPELGTRIEVVGKFSSYQGFDFPYNYLAVDGITSLD